MYQNTDLITSSSKHHSAKNTLRNRELWRQVDVMPLQKVTTQTDILRIFCRTYVTLKISLTATLELHVGP